MKRLIDDRTSVPLALLLLAFVGLALTFTILNPIWEAPDEPQHFQYVKFIAEHHRLPALADNLPSLSLDATSEVMQPPLYYLLAASLVAPLDLNSNVSWALNPYITVRNHPLKNALALHTLSEGWPYQGMILGVHLLRLLSVLVGAVTVWLVYLIGLEVTPGRGFALTAAAAAAFTPSFLLSSSSINNDNAAIAVSSLALLVLVKIPKRKEKVYLWLGLYGLTCALALGTKLDTLFLLPTGALLAIVMAVRDSSQRGSTWGRRLASNLAVLIFPLAIITAISGQGQAVLRIVGSRLAQIYANVTTGHYANPAGGAWRLISNLYETYWGSFGWDTVRFPPLFYWRFLLILLLALLGLSVAVAHLIRSELPQGGGPPRDRLLSFLLLSSAVPILFAMVGLRYFFLVPNPQASELGLSHARFLLPALAPISILLVAGLKQLHGFLQELSLLALFAMELSTAAYSLYVVPQLFGPSLPIYGDERSAPIQHRLALELPSGLRLAGWSLVPASAAEANGLTHLSLFWEEDRPISPELSAKLVLDGSGNSFTFERAHLGELKELPAGQWLPDVVVREDWSLRLPASVDQSDYSLQLSVASANSLAQQNAVVVVLGHVSAESS